MALSLSKTTCLAVSKYLLPLFSKKTAVPLYLTSSELFNNIRDCSSKGLSFPSSIFFSIVLLSVISSRWTTAFFHRERICLSALSGYSGETDQRHWRDGDRRSAVNPTSVQAKATKVCCSRKAKVLVWNSFQAILDAVKWFQFVWWYPLSLVNSAWSQSVWKYRHPCLRQDNISEPGCIQFVRYGH